MDRKKTIIISITGIIITILALLGFTYGYYLTAIKGNENSKSVELITGISSVLFTDLSESNISEIIEPGYEMTKSFTVENTGEITATYSIYFVDVYNDFVRTEDVRYKLYRIDNNSEFPDNYEGCVTNPTDEKQCKIIVEDAEFPTEGESLIQANEQILVTGDTYRYDLVITYINHPTINQNADQGHIFRGKINLMGDVTGLINPFKYGTLAYSILNNAKFNRNGTKFVETTPSKVAEEISQEDEKVLSLAEDDLGPSYYFRGNVEDNYVTFAGMCWRIVRIDGNGNAKLILEDQDEVCSTTMNGNWDIEASDGTSITLDGPEPYRMGVFGYGYDNSTSIYKMSYLNPVDSPNRAMVNAFKYFQTNTLTNKVSSTYENKSLSDYLLSGNWCLNNKAYSDSTGTTILENPTYTSPFYYDSYVRLYGKTTKEPTLKCPIEPLYKFDDNQDGVISSNETDMYVGTITADEIVYAGGKVYEGNSNYYLINNFQVTNLIYFWSLSPEIFDGSFDYAFCVDYDDGLSSGDVRIDYIAFRPSVSLASSVSVTSGEGTLESPYIIG